jgi:FkbM family methyltransferase
MFGEIFHARLYDAPSIPVRAGDEVVDVGANHGFATCYFASRGARITAFEPSPTVFALLEANVRRNRRLGLLPGETRLHPAAVGPPGEVELLVSEDLGGGMTTTIPAFAAATRVVVAERIRVPSVSLNSVLESIDQPRIRLVKLDCEGAEALILSTLSSEQRERVDCWAIEVHPQAYDLPVFIESLLEWEDWHLSKAAEFGVGNANLFLVSRRALREAAAGGFR